MIDHREEQIKLLAKQMKLPTFANYKDILQQAKPGADFSDLLPDLLMAEASARQENQNRRRLKAAAFPYQKTLDEFDFTQLNENVSPLFIQELASCKFIDEHKNIVMIGNPGRGKTHISIALGLKACLQGYSRYFLLRTCCFGDSRFRAFPLLIVNHLINLTAAILLLQK